MPILIQQSKVDENNIGITIFIQTIGFLIGLFLGAISGYFGNWLWYKFKPKPKYPMLKFETTPKGIYMTALANSDNRENIINTIKANIPSKRSMEKLIEPPKDPNKESGFVEYTKSSGA